MASELTAPDPHAGLRALIEALLEDTLAPQQVGKFEELVRANRESRRLYLSYMLLHRCLPRYVGAQTQMVSSDDLSSAMILPAIRLTDPNVDLDEKPSPAARIDSAASLPIGAPIPLIKQRRRPFGNLGRWTALAAAILLVSGTALILLLHRAGTSPEPIAMGQSLDAIWSDPTSVPVAGSLLKTGVAQSLASGYAELTSANGLTVLIQGPATFTVEKPGVVSLASGKLTASVPKAASGFTVNTPVASVVDLGTEFGVSVSATGETDVQTFRGTVSLSSTASPAAAPAISITAGLARHVSSSGDIAEIPANSITFVRPQQFDHWKSMPQDTAFERWQAYSQRLRLDPDLVAYYTFDKSDASPERLLNQASSGAALDGILRGANASHQSPSWATGRWAEKGALNFISGISGSHQRVEIPATVDGPLDFSRGELIATPFTVCAWLRSEDPHPSHSSIVLRGTVPERQFAIELFPDSSIHARVGDAVAASPLSSVNGNWQQLALCYDPQLGKMELYLNGILLAANANAPRRLPQTKWPLAIGNIESDKAFLPPMVGRIDELAVFRRALSAEQVKKMYLAEKPE